jgi:hypothetical protein
VNAEPPSAFQLMKVVSLAQETLQRLREEDGLVLDSAAEVLAALNGEGVDARTILQKSVRAARAANLWGDLQDKLIADLRSRRERAKREEAAWRRTVAAIMETILPADAAGKRQYRDPEFTLSLAPKDGKVVITDEAALPPEMVKEKVVKSPDIDAIEAALARGADVTGAHLDNGSVLLTIRSK